MLTHIQISSSKPAAKPYNLSDSQGLHLTITFKEVAQEWIAKCEREGRAAVTLDKIRWLLGMAYPLIGSHPIDGITPHEAPEHQARSRMSGFAMTKLKRPLFQ